MKQGFLLVDLGTPEAPTGKAVRRYLREFLSDPRVVPLPRFVWLPLLYAVITPLRSRRVVQAYRSIWMEKGSPLAVHTLGLADALRNRGWCTAAAMRYGHPSLEEGIEQLLAQGVSRLIVLPMYPQYSQTTTAAVFDRMAEVLSSRSMIPTVDFRNEYHAEPAYVEAVADSIETFWKENGRPQKLLFSFHGLPEKSRIQGDPYFDQCLESASLIATALELSAGSWQVVFQSRFGPAKWLKPYCVDVLRHLPEEGIMDVDIVCPGFAVDCLETLEEIAHTNREIFLQAGGRQYRYIPALNTGQRHVRMLTGLFKQEAAD